MFTIRSNKFTAPTIFPTALLKWSKNIMNHHQLEPTPFCPLHPSSAICVPLNNRTQSSRTHSSCSLRTRLHGATSPLVPGLSVAQKSSVTFPWNVQRRWSEMIQARKRSGREMRKDLHTGCAVSMPFWATMGSWGAGWASLWFWVGLVGAKEGMVIVGVGKVVNLDRCVIGVDELAGY